MWEWLKDATEFAIAEPCRRFDFNFGFTAAFIWRVYSDTDGRSRPIDSDDWRLFWTSPSQTKVWLTVTLLSIIWINHRSNGLRSAVVLSSHNCMREDTIIPILSQSKRCRVDLVATFSFSIDLDLDLEI